MTLGKRLFGALLATAGVLNTYRLANLEDIPKHYENRFSDKIMTSRVHRDIVPAECIFTGASIALGTALACIGWHKRESKE